MTVPLSQLNSDLTASIIWLGVRTHFRWDFASVGMETQPHMLVRLPHSKTGSVWHLSGFAFLLAVHTLVFSWTWRNSFRQNCFFPPQFSQSIGDVSGFMANGKLWNCPCADILSFYICKCLLWSLSCIPFLSFSFYYHLFDFFNLWENISLHLFTSIKNHPNNHLILPWGLRAVDILEMLPS